MRMQTARLYRTRSAATKAACLSGTPRRTWRRDGVWAKLDLTVRLSGNVGPGRDPVLYARDRHRDVLHVISGGGRRESPSSARASGRVRHAAMPDALCCHAVSYATRSQSNQGGDAMMRAQRQLLEAMAENRRNSPPTSIQIAPEAHAHSISGACDRDDQPGWGNEGSHPVDGSDSRPAGDNQEQGNCIGGDTARCTLHSCRPERRTMPLEGHRGVSTTRSALTKSSKHTTGRSAACEASLSPAWWTEPSRSTCKNSQSGWL